MSSVSAVANEESIVPWWLVLIEGIAAIIVGVLLLFRPGAGTILLVQFLGIYWLVSGIFTLISLIWDRTAWGWKLFNAVLGILAGLLIVQNPLWSTLLVPATLAVMLGVLGVIIGILQLIDAFRGGGWGVGILGGLSILLGFLLITRPVIAGLALPFMLGGLLVAGGVLAIIGAFALRSVMRKMEASTASQPAKPATQSAEPISVPPIAAPTTAMPTSSAPMAAAGLAAAGMAASEEMAAPETEEIPRIESEESTAPSPEEEEAAEDSPMSAAPVAAPTTAVPTTSAPMAAMGAAAAGAAAAEEALESDAAEDEEMQAAPMPPVETAPESETSATAEADSEPATPEAELTGNIDLSDPSEMAKFKHELQYVEGIGPAYAGKLEQAGLTTCLDLLQAGATRKGREAIVAQTGLSSALVLKWVNHVDLYRIKGVGSEYADLLEAAGVDTVVELAQRNPGNLYARMVEINQEKALVRQMPTTGQVADWIGQAKGLPRVVSY